MISNLTKFFKKRSLYDVFSYIYNGFCVPALLVHELLHYIAIKLTRSVFNGVSIMYGDRYEKTGELAFKISWIPRNTLSNKIIAISPIVMIPLFLIAYLLMSNIFTMSALIYTLLCYKQSLPSKSDLVSFKEDVKSGDYDFNLILSDDIPNIEK